MKKHFLLGLLSLSMGACNDTTPAPSNAAAAKFDQEFTLYPQQQAQLPGSSAPELTVTLADLDFTYCPPGAACLVGTNVFPKLSITDAQGQSQQLALPLARIRTFSPNWIDSTNFRANGRRYLLYYRKWHVPTLPMGQIPQKKDISVTLQVMR